jgi:hypothetical protein
MIHYYLTIPSPEQISGGTDYSATVLARETLEKEPKKGAHRPCWQRTPSPAILGEQALEILPRCPHQRLTVDAPQEP